MSDTYFLIVGIILTLIGILSIVSGINSKIRCSYRIDGVVAGVKDKVTHHRGRTIHSLSPIVRYVYEGQKYEKKADVSTANLNKYCKGDGIEIFIDPKRPEVFRVKHMVYPYVLGVMLMACGLLLVYCYFL